MALPRGQKMTSKVRKSLKGWEKDPKMVEILLDGDCWVSDIGDWGIWTRNYKMLLQSDSPHAALVSCTLLSGGICGHRKWEKVLDSLWDFKRLCQRFLQQQHKAMFDTNRLAGWLWICCGQRQKKHTRQKSSPKRCPIHDLLAGAGWIARRTEKDCCHKSCGISQFHCALYISLFTCLFMCFHHWILRHGEHLRPLLHIVRCGVTCGRCRSACGCIAWRFGAFANRNWDGDQKRLPSGKLT